MIGSITTRRAPVRTRAQSRTPTCAGKRSGSRTAPVLRCRTKTRSRSAPRACSRGRMVSSAPSSPLRTMAVPDPGPGDPSGKGRPVLSRAQRSRVSSDLPRPGSPSRMANLPRASRPGQSQSIPHGVNWLTGCRHSEGSLGEGGDMPAPGGKGTRPGPSRTDRTALRASTPSSTLQNGSGTCQG
jgi:hypothetical protein